MPTTALTLTRTMFLKRNLAETFYVSHFIHNLRTFNYNMLLGGAFTNLKTNLLSQFAAWAFYPPVSSLLLEMQRGDIGGCLC